MTATEVLAAIEAAYNAVTGLGRDLLEAEDSLNPYRYREVLASVETCLAACAVAHDEHNRRLKRREPTPTP